MVPSTLRSRGGEVKLSSSNFDGDRDPGTDLGAQ